MDTVLVGLTNCRARLLESELVAYGQRSNIGHSMLRGLCVILTFVLGVILLIGGVCNAWAAWVPPGSDGPNHEYYKAVATLYYSLGGVLVSIALLLTATSMFSRTKE